MYKAPQVSVVPCFVWLAWVQVYASLHKGFVCEVRVWPVKRVFRAVAYHSPSSSKCET